MKRWNRWLAVAVSAAGLVGGAQAAFADEPDAFGAEAETKPLVEQTNYQRGREEGDAASRLDRVVEKLDRLVDQMQAARQPSPPGMPRGPMGPGVGGPGMPGGPPAFRGPGSTFGPRPPFGPGAPGMPGGPRRPEERGDHARGHRDHPPAPERHGDRGPHGRDEHAGRHAEHGRAHGDREHRGPGEREHHERAEMRGEGRRDPAPRWGGADQERMREMMQQGMREAQRRMEQARDKVRELEERIKKLEAEVERMKST